MDVQILYHETGLALSNVLPQKHFQKTKKEHETSLPLPLKKHPPACNLNSHNLTETWFDKFDGSCVNGYTSTFLLHAPSATLNMSTPQSILQKPATQW